MTNLLLFPGRHLPQRAENRTFVFYRVGERHVVINRESGISYDITRQEALDAFSGGQDWKQDISA